MKTFRNLGWQLTAVLCALVIGSAAGAAVGGIFTTVNSTSGYKVNGSAGTSGQCLTSNGTFFAVPLDCVPTFTGTSGYQLLPSGLILEWGTASPSTPNAPFLVTLPLNLPNACLITVVSDNGSRVTSGNPSPSAGQCTSTGTITVNSEASGGGGAEPLGYIVIGY